MDVILKENIVIYDLISFIVSENEKLFDWSDLNLYGRTVFHGFFLIHHVFATSYMSEIKKNIELCASNPDITVFRDYRIAFLTGWNFAFQTIFLTLALTHDILEWSSRHSSSFGQKIKYWRDVVFCSLVVPYTVFVTAMFWSLYWIDRELVFPQVLDEITPPWFNHCIHTNISILLVVETILQARRQPTSPKLEFTLNATVAIGYAVVYYSIFFITGHWLYKVFGIMTWWQVCLYQLLIWTSNFGAYYLQFPINRAIHGTVADNNETQEENEKVQNGGITQDAITNTDAADILKANVDNNENELKESGVVNGVVKSENSLRKNAVLISSLKGNPMDFDTKSWSLKYRSIRNQFEQNSL